MITFPALEHNARSRAGSNTDVKGRIEPRSATLIYMSNEGPVHKSLSLDRTYIDYSRGNIGVRVWKDQCRAIVRADTDSEWDVRELTRPIPVADGFQKMPIGEGLQPVHALAFQIAALANHELKMLASGVTSFKEAVATLCPD